MRFRYIVAGILAASALCWLNWHTVTPSVSPKPVNSVENHTAPHPPRLWAAQPEPRELIDLSSSYEPVSDEDRAPTLTELQLIGYRPEREKPSEAGWLEKLFPTEPTNPLPAVWKFTEGKDFPGATGSESPISTVE